MPLGSCYQVNSVKFGHFTLIFLELLPFGRLMKARLNVHGHAP